MPSSPASDPVHHAFLSANFPAASGSRSVLPTCGDTSMPSHITTDVSIVTCKACKALLDTKVSEKLTKPPRGDIAVCPRCGSLDITDASQSLDCNNCGHSW